MDLRECLLDQRFVEYVSPNTHIRSTKAVANGALAWYLHGAVTTRINKFHYGVPINLEWDASNPEMHGRTRYVGADGMTRVNGGWSSIVAKASMNVTPDS
jgi:hypothetical protein